MGGWGATATEMGTREGEGTARKGGAEQGKEKGEGKQAR